MNLFKKPQAVPNQRSPLPPHLASLLRESWWLGLVVAAIYLVLVLLSYHPTDPGWSHSATHAQLQNRGGELGAWISDLLLYIFGVSAWWWVVFCVTAIWWGYKRIDRVEPTNKPVAVIRFSGFLMLLLASCGLESLRMYSMKAALPLAPGGMLGAVVGDWLARVIGFSGATLLMLALIAVGFSVFTGISWLQVMESLGTWLERSYFWAINSYEAWQDRKIGAVAKVEREEKVKVEKKKQEVAEPIHIEPAQLEVPVAKKVEKAIEQEQRKEIQKKIGELEAKRQAFIAEERKKQVDASRPDSLGEAFLTSAPYAEARDALCAIPGIGPFSAAAILLRGLGRMDDVPLAMKGFAEPARDVYGAAWDPRATVRRYGPALGYWSFYLKTGAARGLHRGVA